MAEPVSVSVTVHVDAPPAAVYALVSDLPRMGEWSPENTGGRWIGGAAGPAPGARFRGTNRNGLKRWSTTVTVVEATPAEAFVFDVTSGPLKVARWSYRITAAASGCDVTESWEDNRGQIITRLGGFFSGVSDRPDFTERSMRQTLERVKAAAEAAA
jgi:hypothetical protein